MAEDAGVREVRERRVGGEKEEQKRGESRGNKGNAEGKQRGEEMGRREEVPSCRRQSEKVIIGRFERVSLGHMAQMPQNLPPLPGRGTCDTSFALKICICFVRMNSSTFSYSAKKVMLCTFFPFVFLSTINPII